MAVVIILVSMGQETKAHPSDLQMAGWLPFSDVATQFPVFPALLN